jgi:hypothetical protein
MRQFAEDKNKLPKKLNASFLNNTGLFKLLKYFWELLHKKTTASNIEERGEVILLYNSFTTDRGSSGQVLKVFFRDLKILSSKEAIQLAFQMSMILLRCPLVPQIMHRGSPEVYLRQ